MNFSWDSNIDLRFAAGLAEFLEGIMDAYGRNHKFCWFNHDFQTLFLEISISVSQSINRQVYVSESSIYCLD